MGQSCPCGSKEIWFHCGVKMRTESWCKLDFPQKFEFTLTIGSLMQQLVKTISLPFIGQMLERLADHEYYCFLDSYSGYNQILIAPEDQEKTTFTCPFGTFQRCMLSLFFDMVEQYLEIFMDISLSTEIHSLNVSPFRTCPPTMY